MEPRAPHFRRAARGPAWPLALLILALGPRCDCGAPCTEGEQRVDGRCLRPCNADRDCPADQICARGYCALGNRLPTADAATPDRPRADLTPADTVAPDHGATDARVGDAPPLDTALQDRGALDAATADRAAVDAEPTDRGPADAVAADATRPDTAPRDTLTADSARHDAAMPDAATTDSAPSDTAVPDTAPPDSAAPDIGSLDSAAPDVTPPDTAAEDSTIADTFVEDATSPCVFGELCDDGDPSTSDDLCMAEGLCRGVNYGGIGICHDDCAAACNPSECCTDLCTALTCECQPGCSCDLRLQSAGNQDTFCRTGSTCSLNGGGTQEVLCEDNAACRLFCGASSTCTMECPGNAQCLIDCGAGSTCGLIGCTPIDCGGGVSVCGRHCPP